MCNATFPCSEFDAHYIVVEQGRLQAVPRRITDIHLDLMFQFKAVTSSYMSTSNLLRPGELSHQCVRCSDTLEYVFQALSAPRSQLRLPRLHPASEVVEPRIEAPRQATPPEFDPLEVPSLEFKRNIIREWEQAMSHDKIMDAVCAACGRNTSSKLINCIKAAAIDFSLLCNPELPEYVLPVTYNRDAYHGALLHPKGLKNPHEQDDLYMCKSCTGSLLGTRKQMPKFALANWLYYGHERLPIPVQQAFSSATFSERLLVSRARASKISYKFSRLPGHYLEGTDDRVSQGCVKGNVGIHPQDATHLNDVLPPGSNAIRDMVCAVFVGDKKPTKETIESLKPILVRKSKVKLLIEFLTTYNPWYGCDGEFQGFSQTNLDSLFGPGTSAVDEGVLCSMEIGHIELNAAIEGATQSYVPGQDARPTSADDDNLLIETVGYTEGGDSPVDYQTLSLKALAHCLRGGRFVQSQAGSRLLPDFENPRLLSWLFPHLDPWGIGGFFEPRRRIPLTLDQQLRYLLSVNNSPFRDDPDFAFVYYNIRQKRAVFDSIAFRVAASQREYVTTELMKVDASVLERLATKFKADPQYRAATPEETSILRLLSKVHTVSHDLPGSNGYKVMLRNQIRALINYEGTPTLFITLNPSDRDHPLVRLYAGHEIIPENVMRGEEYDRWRRTQIAAQSPAACARFFDQMMSLFLSVILGFGGKKGGLFG
ncbi:hypothetical protein C2E23DRAFT_738879, partial [Lenzites betulinus]